MGHSKFRVTDALSHTKKKCKTPYLEHTAKRGVLAACPAQALRILTPIYSEPSAGIVIRFVKWAYRHLGNQTWRSQTWRSQNSSEKKNGEKDGWRFNPGLYKAVLKYMAGLSEPLAQSVREWHAI